MPKEAGEADSYYSVAQAARLLGLEEIKVLSLLTSGQLEGTQDEQARWWIPAPAVDEALWWRRRGADTPADPPSEETIEMPAISPTDSEDTRTTDKPVREELPEVEASAGPTRRTPPTDAGGHSVSESGWTTTDQAARALGVSPRHVRRFIERGDLVGRKVTEGIVEAWEVSIDSLYALRDKRRVEGQVRRHVPRKSVEPQGTADMTDYVRDLTDRLLRLSSEASELRTRLELTYKAESTLQEERDRLRQDLERERQERQNAQEEARRLGQELEVERSKGFWQRLFGG